MATPAHQQRALQFGNFTLETATAELRRNGVPVKLAYQPARILAFLAIRAGETVAREEIATEIWGSNTFVGYDQGLNAAIRQIRAALGDDADHPRFIETVPKRGYRFIGEVKTGAKEGAIDRSRAPERSATSPADPNVLASHSRAGRSMRKWLVSAVVAIALAAALWWYTPLPPPSIGNVEQITTAARIDTPVRPVSDGNWVYYIERDVGHWRLMKAALAGGLDQPVEAPGPNALPLDYIGQSQTLILGVFERRGALNQVWLLPEKTLAPMRLGNLEVPEAIVSPDGKHLAYTRSMSLWTIGIDGTDPHKVGPLPAPASWLAWSPDGGEISFTVSAGGSDHGSSIWEISLDGHGLHPFPLPNRWQCCGSWTRDGRYFIYSASDDGVQWNLWAFRQQKRFWRRSPAGPFQLTFGPDSPWGGTPARDGRHIVFYNGRIRQEYLRLDPVTWQFSSLTAGSEAPFSYSRDEHWAAYPGDRGALYRSRADGSERIELVPPGAEAAFPRWSPDGKWIVFGATTPAGVTCSEIVPADGGNARPVLPCNSANGDPDWSGDGRNIVLWRVFGAANSAHTQLLIVDAASGAAQPIAGSDDLAMSRCSYDGRFIAATQTDQSELKLYDVQARNWRVVAHGRAIGIAVWSSDSRYLYFQDLLGRGEPLFRYNVLDRRVERLGDFSSVKKYGVSRCAFYGLAPDGSPIMLLTKGALDLFAAELRLP